MLDLDLETYLIQPGKLAPRPVSICHQGDEAEVPSLRSARDPSAVETIGHALISDGGGVSLHNAAFDLAVLHEHAPELRDPIWYALDEGRVYDTMISAKLIDIARGCYRGRNRGTKWGYDLGDVAERTCHEQIDKSDPWRTRYGTLDGVPIEDWPEDARRYAIRDVEATRAVRLAQREHAGFLEDLARQVRAAWMLHLQSAWGLMVDEPTARRFYDRVLADLERDREVCVEAGLVSPSGRDGKGKRQKEARAYMEALCAARGEEPPRTDTGNVSLDEDACLGYGDEVLQAYQRYGSAGTILGRTARLFHGTVTPVQVRYDSLVETGRTSASQGAKPKVVDGVERVPPQWGVQIQNFPSRGEKAAIRECFHSRPGYWFSVVDWSGMELCSWAQACLWLVGRSRLAEVINASGDPGAAHTDLGISLAQSAGEDPEWWREAADGKHGKEAKKKFKSTYRQTAKIANFGFPGGMGPMTLRRQARSQYKVELSEREVYHLRDMWMTNWPEAQAYFGLINKLLRKHRDGKDTCTVRTLVSRRVRAKCHYTVACNGFFQGLAADAAKDAGYRLARECYLGETPDGRRSPLAGCRPVWFVHDEYGIEVPAHPELAHLAARRQEAIMVQAANDWMPDVVSVAEPGLGKKWSKGIGPVYRDGMLIPIEDAA